MRLIRTTFPTMSILLIKEVDGVPFTNVEGAKNDKQN